MYCFNPESMLSEVKERLQGPKYNIDFGGRGWGKDSLRTVDAFPVVASLPPKSSVC